ncbi:hypothetical protein BURMUCGD2_2586 [Burkholderia multivorans CGD2]|uniref:Uncharacterized protein n=1 Tax=Burkholderia multivorans CGD2 TaxID=513052 RepID=B9BZT3_9BURK|nr:hypothetical protein BURMUCGD2_2586 [Burkholderia multivorans CGD2]
MPQTTLRTPAASQQFGSRFGRAAYLTVSKGKKPLPDSDITGREADFLQFFGRFFDIADGSAKPVDAAGRAAPVRRRRACAQRPFRMSERDVV